MNHDQPKNSHTTPEEITTIPCKQCHWSSDVERDERVRAEEDNRQGPLPTLTEAIGEVFPRQEATVSRLMTERVTLEVMGWAHGVPSSGAMSDCLKACGLLAIDRPSYVRVVTDEEREGEVETLRARLATLEPIAAAHRAAIEAAEKFNREQAGKAVADRSSVFLFVNAVEEGFSEGRRGAVRSVLERIVEERDTAIREREELRAGHEDVLKKERQANGMADMIVQRDEAVEECETLRAKVKELQDASGGVEKPRWWLTEEQRKAVDHARAALKTRADVFLNSLDASSASICESNAAILLDLLAQETMPRWWLSAEEKGVLEQVAHEAETSLSKDRLGSPVARVTRAMLARNSPPEVEWIPIARIIDGVRYCRADSVEDALAKAGVKSKGVG